MYIYSMNKGKIGILNLWGYFGEVKLIEPVGGLLLVCELGRAVCTNRGSRPIDPEWF